MTQRFVQRVRTAAQLSALDAILPRDFFQVESDTGKVKRGDGLTAWTSLPYWPPAASVDRAEATGSILGTTVEDAINNTRFGIVAAAGVLNATNTYANVTGLTFSIVASGVYVIEAHLFHTAETTGTGVQFALNGPTIGAGTIVYNIIHPLTATTLNFDAGVAYQTAQTSTSTVSATVPALAVLSGAITNGDTAGTLAVQFRSEDTNDAIITGGSWARVTRLA
jgi:hypothetical protein